MGKALVLVFAVLLISCGILSLTLVPLERAAVRQSEKRLSNTTNAVEDIIMRI